MPRVHQHSRSRPERRANTASLIEVTGSLAMPGCSNCKKAKTICYVSSIHPDCARCVRLGSRYNVLLNVDEGRHSFLGGTVVFIKFLVSDEGYESSSVKEGS